MNWVLAAAGPHAKDTAQLFWFYLVVQSVVGALVLGVLFVALWRKNGSSPPNSPPKKTRPEVERRLGLAVGLAVATTVLILTVFVGASYAVDRNLVDLDQGVNLEIEVTAHQWWWELRYLSGNPSEVFTTANEAHVPVGAKVRFVMQSNDVIHSLWFPNLAGKKDIIPGRGQNLVVRADQEGVWRGVCAEFCGLEHAKMGLILFAEPPEKYEAWAKLQREPARVPISAEEKRGREIFTTGACAVCHVVRGTEAAGYSARAPDLTHLKSRTTIGAGAAPNSKGYLGGWILDPHGIKPGVHMPPILQNPTDFQALLAYLETLQ